MVWKIVAIYKTLIYNIIGGKMTTLTVRINDNRAEALKVKAEQYGTPLEDLLIASMENLLSQPAGDFERTMEYVLCKNRELYRRLVRAKKRH